MDTKNLIYILFFSTLILVSLAVITQIYLLYIGVAILTFYFSSLFEKYLIEVESGAYNKGYKLGYVDCKYSEFNDVKNQFDFISTHEVEEEKTDFDEEWSNFINKYFL
jgi:hypothetical protein